MFSDNVFVMQCLVSILMMGISTALIFYPPNDASFTIGISMLSSITGYWFPNPQRKQKNENSSNNNAENGNSGSNDSGNDNNSGNGSVNGSGNDNSGNGDGNVFSDIIPQLGRRRGRRHRRDEESGLRKQDRDDGAGVRPSNDVEMSDSVHIPVGNDSRPPQRDIQGLSRSVKDTVAKIDSGKEPFIHVDGQRPAPRPSEIIYAKTPTSQYSDSNPKPKIPISKTPGPERRNPNYSTISELSRDSSFTSVNDAHIAV